MKKSLRCLAMRQRSRLRQRRTTLRTTRVVLRKCMQKSVRVSHLVKRVQRTLQVTCSLMITDMIQLELVDINIIRSQLTRIVSLDLLWLSQLLTRTLARLLLEKVRLWMKRQLLRFKMLLFLQLQLRLKFKARTAQRKLQRKLCLTWLQIFRTTLSLTLLNMVSTRMFTIQHLQS